MDYRLLYKRIEHLKMTELFEEPSTYEDGDENDWYDFWYNEDKQDGKKG